MKNKFELSIDEKLSLEARLEVLRKYVDKIKTEIKKTKDLLIKEQENNPNQLNIIDEIRDRTNDQE